MKNTVKQVVAVPRKELLEADDEYGVVQKYFGPWLDSLREPGSRWKVAEKFSVRNITEETYPGVVASHSIVLEGEVHVIPKYDKGFCQSCGNKIEISIFKGGDWCSDICRKRLGEDA